MSALKYFPVGPLPDGPHANHPETCRCRFACSECGGRDIDGGIHTAWCSHRDAGVRVFHENSGLRVPKSPAPGPAPKTGGTAMISPENLVEYIAALRVAGVRGRVRIGEIELDVTDPPRVTDAGPARPRSPKDDYERMLFACTEGIPEDDDHCTEAAMNERRG